VAVVDWLASGWLVWAAKDDGAVNAATTIAVRSSEPQRAVDRNEREGGIIVRPHIAYDDRNSIA
jgi:hypothetical protein